MSGGVYKVIEIVGTSTESWEAAAKKRRSKPLPSTLQDVRIASVVEQDVRLEQNKMVEFRVKLKVSFKYHKEHGD